MVHKNLRFLQLGIGFDNNFWGLFCIFLTLWIDFSLPRHYPAFLIIKVNVATESTAREKGVRQHPAHAVKGVVVRVAFPAQPHQYLIAAKD